MDSDERQPAQQETPVENGRLRTGARRSTSAGPHKQWMVGAAWAPSIIIQPVSVAPLSCNRFRTRWRFGSHGFGIATTTARRLYFALFHNRRSAPFDGHAGWGRRGNSDRRMLFNDHSVLCVHEHRTGANDRCADQQGPLHGNLHLWLCQANEDENLQFHARASELAIGCACAMLQANAIAN